MWSRPCWGLSSPRAPTIGRTIAGAISYHRVTRRRFLRGSMRNVRTTLLLFVLARPLIAQGEPPQVTADEPYTMEYYYKVQWGHQQEFLCLSLKNHYPLLPKGVESGRMISVKIETPANHMTEDAPALHALREDRKSTRLNSSHANISYAVFCLKNNNSIR